MLTTRFTQLVGCVAPVQMSPMGAIATPELVGAVTAAGGMGMTSAPGAPAAVVEQQLAAVASQARGPFGFNVVIPFLDEDVVRVASRGCTLVDFYCGNVDPGLVRIVHDGGALAGWQAGSVDEARAAAAAGCDLLVVRGIEGGGRMYGSRGLWPLLAEVLDAVDIPVLASGGVATGRLLAAALAAGADGVRMGTRLIATPESGAHDRYKEALVAASATDSVLTDAFAQMWPDTVRSSRVLQRAMDESERAGNAPVAHGVLGDTTVEIPPFAVVPPSTDFDGNIEAMAMYAGESAGAVDAVQPAERVVREVVADAEARLRATTTAFGDKA
jgi:NAD(P)H-dependent flavin oxidoreductase YrpB (nitropropane dioxygenase family)